MKKKNKSEYTWNSGNEDKSYPYLSKTLQKILNKLKYKKKLLDIGCGNGSLTKILSKNFNSTFAIDTSNSAIYFAKKNNLKKVKFKVGSLQLYQSKFKRNTFDTITAIEVIEHVYSPDLFLKDVKKIMNKKTNLIISTPFHGYFKNLLISIFGKFDDHFNPLWEHGHIKFWSVHTFKELLSRNGLKIKEIYFSGRFYPLSKSMIFLINLK